MKKLLILLLLLGSQVLVARGSVEYTGGIQQLSVSNAAPDLLTNWTWAVWIKPEVCGTCAIVGRWTDSGHGRQIQFDLDGGGVRKVRVSIPFLAWGVVMGGTALANGTWYHVAVTRSGNTWTIYLNGVSDGTASNATAQESGGTFLLLNQNTFNVFQGKVAEMCGWDAVLTAGEISALAHGTPPNRIRATKIKYYWPFHTRNTVGVIHYWPDLGGGAWTATASGSDDLISDHAPVSPLGGAN